MLCRSLVLLTANNASLRRDMLRRTLRLRIVVPDEKPELRRFDFDPVEEATRDRRELLAAAFTVLLAWLRVRDLPENKAHRKPLGSFEEWADLVAGAVSWLTGTNPVDLIEAEQGTGRGRGRRAAGDRGTGRVAGRVAGRERPAATDVDREGGRRRPGARALGGGAGGEGRQAQQQAGR